MNGLHGTGPLPAANRRVAARRWLTTTTTDSGAPWTATNLPAVAPSSGGRGIRYSRQRCTRH
jgi:hypothetical protein